MNQSDQNALYMCMKFSKILIKALYFFKKKHRILIHLSKLSTVSLTLQEKKYMRVVTGITYCEVLIASSFLCTANGTRFSYLRQFIWCQLLGPLNCSAFPCSGTPPHWLAACGVTAILNHANEDVISSDSGGFISLTIILRFANRESISG